MCWSFAIVNNKLAEIFFENKRGKTCFYGHVYVKEPDYATKKERRWIKEDSDRYQLTYRKGMYKDKNTGQFFEVIKLEEPRLKDGIPFDPKEFGDLLSKSRI